MKRNQPTPSITAAFVALENDLEKDITYLQQEQVNIKKRRKDVIKRHQAISENNGGAATKPSDIITLNVSGTQIFARRDTLTAFKGSRLEALFSGRWENRLLRDEKNHVFMDAEPVAFVNIIKYLKIVKLSAKQGNQESGSAKPLCYPTVCGAHEKKIFYSYIDIFQLRHEANTTPATTTEEVDRDNEERFHIQSQRALIEKMKAELDDAEERLEQEESFVSCFVSKDNQQQQQEGFSESVDSTDSSGIIIDTDSPLSSKHAERSLLHDVKRASLDDEACGILNLYIDGLIMVVKRSTLCLDPQSKLAQDFSDDDWLHEHKVVHENGKTMFVVDHSAGAFKAMVHHLQVKSMAGDVDDVCLPSIEIEDEFEREYFKKMRAMYFGHNEDFIKLKEISMDTIIVEDKNHEMQIKDWLGSVNRRDAPKLLYRASRDGWDAIDFHARCDGKGATLVLVKSEGGCVFGGYTDVSWSSPEKICYKSSKESFLFSLKCYAGLPPVKMDVMNGKRKRAVLHCTNSGPSFGNDDLNIGSNANANVNEGSNTEVGEVYKLPNGTTDSYFLTGSTFFKVEEWEVFQV